MNSENQKIEQSLNVSFKDGIFASAMMGFTQDYFIPFLLVLGGTASQVGILSAVPNFFSAIVQLKSAEATIKAGSRKPVMNIFVFLQAVTLLPIAMLAWFQKGSPVLLICFVTLFATLGAFPVPAWGSLMSDLVPEHKRGEYFGWRNRILGCIIVGSSFLAGVILQHMKSVNVFHGFALIFLSACIFRLISWNFLRRMYEPALIQKKEEQFTLYQFLARIKESNFARFVLFVSFLSFSVNLAAPHFSVFMLRDLHFSYLLYSLITVTATLTVYLLSSRWGRLADRVGNLKVMKFTAPIISILPVFWIINRNPFFLFFTQIVSGFAWAGFNLCASNFIYDAVSPPKRTRCIAYFNLLNGLALAFGALIGGFIVSRLPELFGYKILSLFLLSSCLRLIMATLLPLPLKEVRAVPTVKSNELFCSMLGVKPILGVERKTIQYENLQ